MWLLTGISEEVLLTIPAPPARFGRLTEPTTAYATEGPELPDAAGVLKGNSSRGAHGAYSVRIRRLHFAATGGVSLEGLSGDRLLQGSQDAVLRSSQRLTEGILRFLTAQLASVQHMHRWGPHIAPGQTCWRLCVTSHLRTLDEQQPPSHPFGQESPAWSPKAAQHLTETFPEMLHVEDPGPWSFMLGHHCH